jgi:hypothetical protein
MFHAALVYDTPIVRHCDSVARAFSESNVLLHHQNRCPACFQVFKRFDQIFKDRRGNDLAVFAARYHNVATTQ